MNPKLTNEQIAEFLESDFGMQIGEFIYSNILKDYDEKLTFAAALAESYKEDHGRLIQEIVGLKRDNEKLQKQSDGWRAVYEKAFLGRVRMGKKVDELRKENEALKNENRYLREKI